MCKYEESIHLKDAPKLAGGRFTDENIFSGEFVTILGEGESHGTFK